MKHIAYKTKFSISCIFHLKHSIKRTFQMKFLRFERYVRKINSICSSVNKKVSKLV